MLSEELEKEVSNLIEIKMNVPDLLDQVKKKIQAGSKPKAAIGKKDKKKDKEALFELEELIEIKHPVLGKRGKRSLIDYGNLIQRIEKRCRGIAMEILNLISSDPEGYKRQISLAEEFLEKVREASIKFIVEKVMSAKNDLRPIMMPGSVARDESPNLYMQDEEYGAEERLILALRLVKSVAVGNWISVYFEGPFHDYLRELVRGKLNKPHLDANDIEAVGWEMGEPFVTLLRLLLWIYGEISNQSSREEVLEMMKSSSGVIYFTPDDSEERYTAYTFPQLNRFVDSWLVNESRRKALIRMLDSVKVTCSVAYKRNRDVAEKFIGLIYRNLDLIASSLIERAIVLWEPLRRVVDLMLDLSDKLEAPADFHFVMLLGEAHER